MRTILIVDDAETMRNMISQVLQSEDYEVISGIDGEDGLGALNDGAGGGGAGGSVLFYLETGNSFAGLTVNAIGV